MKIVMAASEAVPFASSGGLAGVMGSLPSSLAEAGHEVSLFLPHYRDIEMDEKRIVRKQKLKTDEMEFRITETRFPKGAVRVFLIGKDEYFDRSGFYGPSDDEGWEDNAERFSFFSGAVCHAMGILLPYTDIIHCHDWQTGLIPAYMRKDLRTAVVFTIHNLQYQGNFPAEDYEVTNLSTELLTPEGIEFYSDFSFMKAGILYSDKITTVSPTYSWEILTDRFGCGMDGILRNRTDVLSGILNGIDTDSWNPADDPAIASSYSAGSITSREECRKELLYLFELTETDSSMIAGMVTRLTRQKGVDLLIPIVEKLVSENIKLAILGTGEREYRSKLEKLAQTYPGSVSCIFKYDDKIARKVFAGSDLYLMPSRFEPCGLAQMSAMRYGAVPLVRKTGGLADTVRDYENGGCGFVFEQESSDELFSTILRTNILFRNKYRWTHLAKKCMKQDNSWQHRSREYERVYKEVLQDKIERTDI